MTTRILYTHTSSLIGGGNKVLLNLFESLARPRFRPFSVIPEPGPLEMELRARDVPYTILDLRPGPVSKLSLFFTILRLAAWCLKNRIDFLHANDPQTYRAASIAARLSGLTRICHVHHPGPTKASLGWAFRIPPQLVITPSLFMKRQVDACLGEPARTRLEAVANHINTDWFRPSEDIRGLKVSLGLDPDGHDISIIGALSPHKGHECFLRAAHLILGRFPRTTFHIVGSDLSAGQDNARFLQRLANVLGIADKVRFWGFVKDELARDLLCASDLFMLPTREEGFGLSIAEAQACRVPVLTSMIAPLDEVVDDGRSGYLIPPQEYEQFARIAIELLGHGQTRKDMGTAGRDWVLKQLSNQTHVDRIMALYEELGVRGQGSGARALEPCSTEKQ